jgi:hypothetical protein
VRVSTSELRNVIEESLVTAGYPAGHIARMVDVMTYAQWRGNWQSLVQLAGPGLPPFQATGAIHVERETAVSALLHGELHPGIAVMHRAMELARDKAKASRVAVVGAHHAAPPGTGAIGYYVEFLATGNAKMIHGRSLLSAALTACSLLWGSVCHHVEREAGRFIVSIPRERADERRRRRDDDHDQRFGGRERARGPSNLGAHRHRPDRRRRRRPAMKDLVAARGAARRALQRLDVTRRVNEHQESGIIMRKRARIVICDPVRLAARARGEPIDALQCEVGVT